jgi:hypothetical protein
MTNIIQAHLIEQNFLNNKNGDRLGELGTMLHDPQAQRNDFGSEEEVDYLHIVCRSGRLISCWLDKGANDPK